MEVNEALSVHVISTGAQTSNKLSFHPLMCCQGDSVLEVLWLNTITKVCNKGGQTGGSGVQPIQQDEDP